MYVAETKDGSVKRKMDAVEVKDGCGEVERLKMDVER